MPYALYRGGQDANLLFYLPTGAALMMYTAFSMANPLRDLRYLTKLTLQSTFIGDEVPDLVGN